MASLSGLHAGPRGWASAAPPTPQTQDVAHGVFSPWEPPPSVAASVFRAHQAGLWPSWPGDAAPKSSLLPRTTPGLQGQALGRGCEDLLEGEEPWWRGGAARPPEASACPRELWLLWPSELSHIGRDWVFTSARAALGPGERACRDTALGLRAW